MAPTTSKAERTSPRSLEKKNTALAGPLAESSTSKKGPSSDASLPRAPAASMRKDSPFSVAPVT